MAKTVITHEIAHYILNNYMNYSSRKIGQKLSVSKTAVLNFMHKNSLVVPDDILKSWKYERIKKPYTLQEHEFMKANIANMSIKQLAKALKRCSVTLLKEAHSIGLTDVILNKKKASQLQPGNVPVNKGKKIQEFMNPEQIAKFQANFYKKGAIPHNALEDGSEVQRVDKSGKIYTLVKVPGTRKLVLKHRFVWEEFHAKKIPYRHKITFKDGNTFNFAVENLVCISYEDQMIQNSIHQYPEELKELLHIKGAITRQINKNQNDNRNNQ